jgi:hypothetical protein
MTKGRRVVRFHELRDVVSEVERLLPGHRTLGRWTLAQICNHLAGALRCTVEGFPADLSVPWIVQQTAGRVAFRVILATGWIIEGFKLPAKYLPAAELDAAQEAAALAKAIERFETSPTPLAPHFLFGPLTRQQWARYHCIHCAHHLSFVIPTLESQ